MLSFKTTRDIGISIAQRSRGERLSRNLSRSTLSKMSGVTEASIKKFELTGEIAFLALLKIAKALNHLDKFEETFLEKKVVTIEDILNTHKKRQRGRK